MSSLEILSPGVFASLQDAGRFGWRRAGVPWSGALDPQLLRIANALVGNPDTAPAIECFDGGLRLAARGGPLRVAVAGDAQLELLDAHGVAHAIGSWRSLTLLADEQLRLVSTGSARLAMLAVAGLAVDAVLGSASTYARARLGGVGGQALTAGVCLPASDAAGPDLHLPSPPLHDTSPIRVVPGPQLDHFAADAFDTFLAQPWTLSAEADRMGLRLSGTPLHHVSAEHREIDSDAIVPGAIQVPGNGQPIVLLADSQTAGGYPKIATVISADRGRIAALKPGASVRFAAVTVAEGEAAARQAETLTRQWLAAIASRPQDATVDLAALYNDNLLSGMVNALSPAADESESGR